VVGVANAFLLFLQYVQRQSLSFAQFEREVTGERIRDKIAASKRKGMWMGGTVPLGYDLKDRKLVVNPEEARAVRNLFGLYLEAGWTQERCADTVL
jgi:DNA invertase Pin-like site-specific DNA recombinase